MKAVILAAGMGSRLRPLTRELPKGLIEIAGKPLLEYSLGALKRNGIKEVILVVGFLAKIIKQRFGQRYEDLKIIYVLNQEYSDTGSMYSFSQARRLVDEDIVLLESDLLYEPKALRTIMDSKHEDVLLVSDFSGSGDEVYVCVDNTHRIIDLGKSVSPDSKKKAVGELVGISRFSKAFLVKLFQKVDNDYARGKVNYHYEECVLATSNLGNPVYAEVCRNLAWAEIDNASDLERARTKIYPRIQRSRK